MISDAAVELVNLQTKLNSFPTPKNLLMFDTNTSK